MGGYYLYIKTCKEQNNCYLNARQGAYRNVDNCFLFGKHESVMSRICGKFSITKTVEKCKFSVYFSCLYQLQLFCGHFREDHGKSYQFGNGG